MSIEIPPTQGYVTRIDDADRGFTDGRKWHVAVVPHRNTIYARTRIDGKSVYMHKLLAPGWGEVDHVDGDGLNNCRANLRDGTGRGKNHANRGMRTDNTNTFKGICRAGSGRWYARIHVNGKKFHLGMYDTPEAAAEAYDRAAVHYFGEYAKTNAMLALL